MTALNAPLSTHHSIAPSSLASRLAIFSYGLFAYALFFVTFCYAIGFVTGLVVPKHLDTGTPGPLLISILINVSLLSLFAIQHTIMARPAFKRWFTQFIPEATERSTFVIAASLILIMSFWLWQPMPTVIWEVQNTVLRTIIYAISLGGFGIVLYSSFLIDHFDLFGLRQVILKLRNLPYSHRPYMERSLYKFVRHPLMLGFIIGFWAAPTMTAGHLLFAAVVTGYVFFGTFMEERDLIAQHGSRYVEYRQRTPMILPFPRIVRFTSRT